MSKQEAREQMAEFLQAHFGSMFANLDFKKLRKKDKERWRAGADALVDFLPTIGYSRPVELTLISDKELSLSEGELREQVEKILDIPIEWVQGDRTNEEFSLPALPFYLTASCCEILTKALSALFAARERAAELRGIDTATKAYESTCEALIQAAVEKERERILHEFGQHELRARFETIALKIWREEAPPEDSINELSALFTASNQAAVKEAKREGRESIIGIIAANAYSKDNSLDLILPFKTWQEICRPLFEQALQEQGQ